jgi:uncharacterized RDD family membrane protein YckC
MESTERRATGGGRAGYQRLYDARAVIRAELAKRNLPEPIPDPATGNTTVALATPMQRFGAAVIDNGTLLGVGGALALGGYESLSITFFLFFSALQIGLLIQRAQTIGKALLGIKIVDEATRDHPGFVKLVLVRGLLFNAAYRIPLFGGALFLVDSSLVFSEQHRTLHDRVAGTLVVTNEQPPQP